MDVSLKEFRKAIEKLDAALQEEKTEYLRDSVIQRFEFCVELAWKTAKKALGSSKTSSKLVLREMLQNNLIDDADFWFQSIDQRNLTSHTYNEDIAESVYSFAEKFLPYAQKLLEKLEKL